MNTPEATRARLLDCVQQTITRGVYNLNFKNGAFKSLISQSMPPAQSLTILSKSVLTTEIEMEICFIMRGAALELSEGTFRMDDLMLFLNVAEALNNAFTEDARSRGMYVADPIMQIIGENGEVTETMSFSYDGKVTKTSGGVPGLPPDAPVGYSSWGMRELEKFSKARKNLGGKKTSGKGDKRGRQKGTEKVQPGTDGVVGDASKAPEKKTKKDTSEFGGGFSKNLRGAFI
ncbi:hypothetical protein GLAREA_07666 [Glarea lozoyensis ATCC 20868]|uniref:Uncharacterized protein n=1 Tax=Glarea lozoyensis (strain ATCC 20868 / MF5171) TaxID=1116229 RepID=S3D1U5_GLAL2|nr:uncharacterized protein GLAREA_07666 [Glarea lozoyensis ATCC 20868]EPE32532.1 hypothetical protein GLAREA_07666 [Glarea lozoyensis ATCC 20868]